MAVVPGSITTPQSAELFAVFGGRGFFDNCLITEVAFTVDVRCQCGWRGAVHIGIEQPNECICCFYHIGFGESLSGDGKETICVTGNVDLDVPLLDVVGLGIVGEAFR